MRGHAQTHNDENIIPLRLATAARVEEQLTGDDHTATVIDKLAVIQMCSREWRRYLDANEYALLSYIVDRTVMWGRISFAAATDNILNGTDVYAGCGLSRRVYFRAIKSLEQKGAITRKSIRDRTQITLNLRWAERFRLAEIRAEGGNMIPVPKRLRGKKAGATGRDAVAPGCNSDSENAENEVRSANMALLEVPYWHTEYSNRKNTSITRRSTTPADADAADRELPSDRKETFLPGKDKDQDFSAADRETGNTQGSAPAESSQPELPLHPVAPVTGETVKDRVLASLTARQRNNEARAKARVDAARQRKKGVTTTDVEAVWKAALHDLGLGMTHVAWGKRERGMVKTAMSRWSDKGASFSDVVHYAVSNWPQIITRRFGWMTKRPAPKAPDLSFFIWRLTDFADAYRERAADGLAHAEHRSELQRLMARGLSYADAMLELAQRQARAALRDEMEKRERKAAQRERIARQREERAARLEGLADRLAGSDAPVEVRDMGKRQRGQVWGYGAAIKPKSPDELAASPAPITPPENAPPLDVPELPSFEEVQRAAMERLKQGTINRGTEDDNEADE